MLLQSMRKAFWKVAKKEIDLLIELWDDDSSLVGEEQKKHRRASCEPAMRTHAKPEPRRVFLAIS